MEWSGAQQFDLVYKGALLGCIIGVLLDVTGGFWRGKSYRWQLFVSDFVVSIIAAMITFFGSLVISDGHLHPVLFVGMLGGALIEHYAIGRWLLVTLFKAHKLLKWCVMHISGQGKRVTEILSRFFARLR